MPKLTNPGSRAATVGGVLHVTAGRWDGSVTVRYQWLRCNAAGTRCKAVQGATKPDYRIGAADAGATLRVRITAIGSHGAGSVLTKPSPRVTKAKPKSKSKSKKGKA
jgi:hypothetical protein